MLVKPTTSPSELREIATSLGIVWVGKSNEDLANEINEKLKSKIKNFAIDNEEQNNKEQNNEEQIEDKIENETQEDIKVNDEGDENEIEVNNQEKANENNDNSKRTQGKWYEQEGAFPYHSNQKIQIVKMDNEKHSFLNGRYAIVVGPSAKRNAVKAQLINDKTGKPQKTKVTFNFHEIEVVNSNDDLNVV